MFMATTPRLAMKLLARLGRVERPRPFLSARAPRQEQQEAFDMSGQW
jgi:hypothetical protein